MPRAEHMSVLVGLVFSRCCECTARAPVLPPPPYNSLPSLHSAGAPSCPRRSSELISGLVTPLIRRTILFATERVNGSDRETLLFILFLLAFAIAAAGHVLSVGLADPARSRRASSLNRHTSETHPTHGPEIREARPRHVLDTSETHTTRRPHCSAR